MKMRLNKNSDFVRCVLAGFLTLALTQTDAQIRRPIKWTCMATPSSTDASVALLKFTATLEEGWHLYSQFMTNEGPLPTTFTFMLGADYSLIGKVKEEGTLIKSHDTTFMMDVAWFSGSVTFVQRVKLHVPATVIKGQVEFMVCTDHECLPPDEETFSLSVTVSKPKEGKKNEKNPVEKAGS